MNGNTMTTPTEQAMRAAEGLIADATVGDSVVTAAVRRAAARIIDTAAGLPELLAERDALRAACARMLVGITGQSTRDCEWYTGIVFDAADEARAALALNAKAHP